MISQRLSRRAFGRWFGAAGMAAAVPALLPRRALAAKAKVVVVGGGPGGATAARLLAQAPERIEVTLVEAQPRYTTGFFSNLHIAGMRSLDSLTHGFEGLAADTNVQVVHGRADAIDPEKKTLRLEGGDALPYDRLVCAPGVELIYGAIEGYDEAAAEVMPHAWKAGAQTALLRRQLLAMEDGGSVVIAPPALPYSCPPAPYERVSLVAAYLKREKPNSKIVILDGKDKFSMQKLFEDGWLRFYDDMIEWLPAEFTGGVQAVDPKAMTVSTEDETFEAAVANIIPPQRAGAIAQQAGLADDTGWCPVEPATLASRLQPDIHVVGDAIWPDDMPKSGSAAHSQATVCALAVRAALADGKPPRPDFHSTCWSLIAADNAVKVEGRYEATGGRIAKVASTVSAADESDAVRAATAQEAEEWYDTITQSLYG